MMQYAPRCYVRCAGRLKMHTFFFPSLTVTSASMLWPWTRRE